jgi:hypothetical protein
VGRSFEAVQGLSMQGRRSRREFVQGVGALGLALVGGVRAAPLAPQQRALARRATFFLAYGFYQVFAEPLAEAPERE